MNEVQINKIKKRADEYATSCFPYEKQFLEREAIVKCCVHVVIETIAELEKQIAELEKENAELKGLKDVATLIRANNDTVVTLMQLNNKLVCKNQQLTKAKDLLAKWVELFKPKLEGYPITPIQEQTEQFLKDCEVEK